MYYYYYYYLCTLYCIHTDTYTLIQFTNSPFPQLNHFAFYSMWTVFVGSDAYLPLYILCVGLTISNLLFYFQSLARLENVSYRSTISKHQHAVEKCTQPNEWYCRNNAFCCTPSIVPIKSTRESLSIHFHWHFFHMLFSLSSSFSSSLIHTCIFIRIFYNARKISIENVPTKWKKVTLRTTIMR